MRRDNVKIVIQKILETPLYADSFVVNQSQLLTEKILSKLPDENLEVELAHVQVFLTELFERAYAIAHLGALPILDQKLVKDHDNLKRVLDRFLKKQLQELNVLFGVDKPIEALALLISERHTKLQATKEELDKELKQKSVVLEGSLEQLLEAFLQRRIVRMLKTGERIQYEISHDMLALVVGRNVTQKMKRREKAASTYRLYVGRTTILSRYDLDMMLILSNDLQPPSELRALIQKSKQFWELEASKSKRYKRNLKWQSYGVVVVLSLSVLLRNDACNGQREAEEAKLHAEDAKQVSDNLRELCEGKLQILLDSNQERIRDTVDKLVKKAEKFKRSGRPLAAMKVLEDALSWDPMRFDVREMIRDWK